MREAASFELDWRDEAAYAALAGADRSLFAWEWLRRDPAYRRAFDRAANPGPIARPAGHEPVPAGCFGLVRFEPPGQAVPFARPLWRRESYPYVLCVRRGAAAGPEDLFDLGRLGRLARLAEGEDGEYLLLSDGFRTIRLDAPMGLLASGPASLAYSIGGLESAQPPLLALRRFLALCAAGRFSSSLHPPERRARRWILLLRAFDAIRSGASQREIAQHLLGRPAGEPRWRSADPSLRSRAQRLVRTARFLAAGGYRRLLR